MILTTPTLPIGAFRWPVLVADPPWQFRDTGFRAAPHYHGTGRAAAHYPVLPLERITALGPAVQRLAAGDALLFLWAPNALVLDGTAQRVAQAWGFAPKQIVPWVKTTKAGRPALGMGHYTRVCTEPLLVCRRGRARVANRAVPGIIFARRQRHSAKPNESYALIERLHPGPYLELFARRRFGSRWTAWGNQL